MAPRSALPPVALGLLAVWASAAPPESSPAAPLPRGVRALEVDLQKAEARLGSLRDLAALREEELQIRAYRRYTEAQFQDQKNREVDVETLWDIVRDRQKKTLTEEIRTAAAVALAETTAAHDHDPDLALAPGRGIRRPKAAFSMKVVAELGARDPLLRRLSAKILAGLWPNIATDPDIASYNPDERKTWKDAQDRWERELKR